MYARAWKGMERKGKGLVFWQGGSEHSREGTTTLETVEVLASEKQKENEGRMLLLL